MKQLLPLFALLALSATLSLAQTPDRAAPNDNAQASNEPVHRGGNWGWIGLFGLGGWLVCRAGAKEFVTKALARVARPRTAGLLSKRRALMHHCAPFAST